MFITIVFTLEYVLRLWTADYIYPDKEPDKARLRYIFSSMAIIDLSALLPFYLPLLIPFHVRALRLLRHLRLFRLFKINRYTDSLQTLARVLRRKSSQLISSIIVVGLPMLVTAVLIYGIENEAQPQVFDNAFSSLWTHYQANPIICQKRRNGSASSSY